jgi:hypothetical protein
MFGKRTVPSGLQNLHHRLLDKPVQHRRDGHCKLHWTAVRIWDGRRSVIHIIRFEGNASKYSRNGA